MGEFVCRVADADGRVFSHVEPANTLDEARQKLADRGLYVYSVESRGGRLGSLVRRRTGRQVGGSDFLILNQQFNTLIKAGLPILKALDLLATRATSPKRWIKLAFFLKFTLRQFWLVKRAAICRACWTTTSAISELAPA